MKLSVCITTYNHKKYIAQALDSVLMQQTDFDFEILVGEDDSSDGTRQICVAYAEKHPGKIKLFLNDRKNVIYIDGKPTGRWNFTNLFKHSKGEYIARCEGDDYWTDPFKLQKQIDFLEKRPDFVICFHHVDWLKDGQISRNKYLPPTNTGYYTADDLFLNDNFIRTCSVVFRNRLFKELPEWFYGIPYGDIAMHILNARHGKVGNIDETMAVYRVHSGGIYSSENLFVNILKSIRTFSTIAKHLNYTDKDSYKIGLAKIHYWLSSESKRIGDQIIRSVSKEGITHYKHLNERNQNQLLVSVIIPTYNRPEMLSEAIQSVLNQTCKDFEIIAVNDAGEDVSGVVLSLNTNNKIKYIVHEKNKGLAASRNTGIRAAKGKYIAYLDDDDVFYPEHLETLITFLEASDCKVAYTDAYRAHQEKENGKYVVKKRDLPYSFDFDYDRILVDNFVPVLCFMHEKSCLDETGLFDESLKKLEDWDLWIRMSRSFKFAHIKKITCEFAWRNDATTMTSGKWPEFVEARKIISEKYKGYLKKKHDSVSSAGFSAMKKDMTSIVILTFNQLTYTKECVESITKHTPEPYEIIFVDNGSRDGTIKWLRKLVKATPNYRLIDNGRNLGFSKGCNQGIEASAGEYILLLNNDVVVTEGWLSGMLECLNSAPDTGIVGPMTNNISGPQKVLSGDYSPAHMDEYAGLFRRKNRYRRVLLRRIVGFCMLFRRELAEKIGLLDEKFGSGNFEDDDFCLRAALEGHRNLIAGDVFIHHYGSKSFTGNRIDYSSAIAGNRKIFTEKWSGIDAKSPEGKRLLAINAIEKADELNQKGQIDKAITMLLEGIQHSPDDKRIYYALSEMLIDAKKIKDALDVLNETPIDEKDVRRLVLTGYCKEGMEIHDEAEEYAERALLLEPASASAWNLKGILAYKKGDKDTAEGFFKKAIEFELGYGEPYTNIGVLKWTAEQREEALNLLERGFILSPTVMDIITSYHSAITSTGEFARAEKVFQEVKALYPLNRRIAFLLIDVLIQQGKNSIAMQEIERAIITFGADDGIISAALEVRNRVGEKKIDKTSKDKCTFSLCMIVKNEQQHLPKCLMSVNPVVDEMIVVDTGSTDRTKDIARAFGARVYDFQWTNDFSEARNFSLSQAEGEWILILDADEVISPLDHASLSKIVEKRILRPVSYSIVTRNYTTPVQFTGWTANNGRYSAEEAGTGWYPSDKVRLFKNDSRIRFENPVHELLEPSLERLGIKIEKCSIPIHHYGKLNTEKNTSKGEDYYLLGKRKLDEKGENNVKAVYELAIQAGELGKYDEALELWQKVIALRPNSTRAFLNIGRAYLELGRYDEALATSKKAVELEPDLKEAVYNYSIGEMYAGDVKKAIEALENLLRQLPDYPAAEVMLAVAYCCDNKREKGLGLFRRLQKMNFDFAKSVYSFAKKLVSAGRIDYANLLLEAAIETNNTNDDILNLHAECNNICNYSGADLRR